MNANLKVALTHWVLAAIYLFVSAWFAVRTNVLPPTETTNVMVAGSIALVAFIHVLLGFGATRSSNVARVGSIAVGALLLLAFPLGTLAALYLLSNCVRKWESIE